MLNKNVALFCVASLLFVLLGCGKPANDKPANDKPANDKPEIVFITDISNSYGRISPAMAINFIYGKEDQKLDDMIDTYYRENQKLEYKRQTENDELALLRFAESVRELHFKAAKYIEGNPQVMGRQYLGNQYILTGVPVGATFYCWAWAQWNNGKGQLLWLKKIVVKPGENEVMLVNDFTAYHP